MIFKRGTFPATLVVSESQTFFVIHERKSDLMKAHKGPKDWHNMFDGCCMLQNCLRSKLHYLVQSRAFACLPCCMAALCQGENPLKLTLDIFRFIGLSTGFLHQQRQVL